MGGGERGAREARGSEDILTWVGGERGREWVGGGVRGARGGQRVRGNFIMGYDPLGWGGNIHGIRKKKFYHGIRPFRVGKKHSWNQEEEILS